MLLSNESYCSDYPDGALPLTPSRPDLGWSMYYTYIHTDIYTEAPDAFSTSYVILLTRSSVLYGL